MLSNEERYIKQLEAAESLLESEFASEMLKVHHEFAKPSVALSRWLLAVTGAAAAALLANAEAASGILGKGYLLAGIVLLLSGGIVGLYAVYLEGVIAARVAGLTGTLTMVNAVIPKVEQYDRSLAQFAASLGLTVKPKPARLPDQEKIASWFEYPETWWSRWTYGSVPYADQSAPYRELMVRFARHAFASKLQLLFVAAVFGMALVDIAWKQFQAAPASTEQVSSPADTGNTVARGKK